MGETEKIVEVRRPSQLEQRAPNVPDSQRTSQEGRDKGDGAKGEHCLLIKFWPARIWVTYDNVGIHLVCLIRQRHLFVCRGQIPTARHKPKTSAVVSGPFEPSSSKTSYVVDAMKGNYLLGDHGIDQAGLVVINGPGRTLSFCKTPNALNGWPVEAVC
jgi:hypothetical protein